MKTLTVKKMDVMSVAKFSAFLAGAVAAVNVVLGWALSVVGYADLNSYFPESISWNWGFGFLALIIIPLVYALAGFVGGAVVAWFYNVALGGSNGVKFDVTE